MEGITVITPTGDRSECLKRCQFYLERQTFTGDIQWIVSDDGKEESTVQFDNLVYVRHDHMPNWKPKQSFVRNFRSMIEHVEHDKVVIMEDDDWYHYDYLKVCSERLDDLHIVGEHPSRYYNIRYQEFRTSIKQNFCDMCMTAFRADLLESFKKIMIDTRADKRFWEANWNKRRKKKHGKRFEPGYVVGIKGSPGRQGCLRENHVRDPRKKVRRRKRKAMKFEKDPKWEKLQRWIGPEDVVFYKELYSAL